MACGSGVPGIRPGAARRCRDRTGRPSPRGGRTRFEPYCWRGLLGGLSPWARPHWVTGRRLGESGSLRGPRLPTPQRGRGPGFADYVLDVSRVKGSTLVPTLDLGTPLPSTRETVQNLGAAQGPPSLGTGKPLREARQDHDLLGQKK